MKTTISVIKADVGSLAGHQIVPEELKDKAREILRESDLLIDFRVVNCGDDLILIMTHDKGEDNSEIHGLAWTVFEECAKLAKKMRIYGAGQDLLKEAFSGNIRGMGPGVAEMEIEERPSEPIAVFACDKTAPSAFNLPLFRIFADPFNTAGLIIDPKLHDGFRFEIVDVYEHKKVVMSCPEEMYDLLALLGDLERFAVKRVYRKDGVIAAVASTEKLSEIAGRYVGKDDPVCIVRAQSGFPAMGEILEAFSLAHLVPGWMRGSHWGPLMPVSMEDAHPTRFDGPPRVIGLGFQVSEGKLYGPVDMFKDPAFDIVRRRAQEITDYLRRHGPFEPHRLPSHEMEYTTLPAVLERIKDRFEPL